MHQMHEDPMFLFGYDKTATVDMTLSYLILPQTEQCKWG